MSIIVRGYTPPIAYSLCHIWFVCTKRNIKNVRIKLPMFFSLSGYGWTRMWVTQAIEVENYVWFHDQNLDNYLKH